jgi:hypothetical protein
MASRQLEQEAVLLERQAAELGTLPQDWKEVRGVAGFVLVERIEETREKWRRSEIGW